LGLKRDCTPGFTPTAGRSGMGGGELKGRAPYVFEEQSLKS
jgi:hypothetical protein